MSIEGMDINWGSQFSLFKNFHRNQVEELQESVLASEQIVLCLFTLPKS